MTSFSLCRTCKHTPSWTAQGVQNYNLLEAVGRFCRVTIESGLAARPWSRRFVGQEMLIPAGFCAPLIAEPQFAAGCCQPIRAHGPNRQPALSSHSAPPKSAGTPLGGGITSCQVAHPSLVS